MDDVIALATTLEMTAAFMFVLLIAPMGYARMEHASANLAGLVCNATQRFARPSAASMEHANPMHHAYVVKDIKEKIAPRRSAQLARMESVGMGFASVLMVLEAHLVQSAYAEQLTAMDTVNAQLDVVCAHQDTMAVIVLLLRVKHVLVIIDTASMALAHVKMDGLERTAKLLSAKMIVLGTEFVMMELVSATLDGLALIARKRSAQDNLARTPATDTEHVMKSVFNAIVMLDGLRPTAHAALA